MRHTCFAAPFSTGAAEFVRLDRPRNAPDADEPPS
jgi:hypothetical protein